jgi:DNA-binding NarL/FixJ family response regulator
VKDLTLREREIADLMTLGHQDKEIAARLGLSTKTVKCHSQNLFHKLGVHRRVDVAPALQGRERTPDLAEAHAGGETCC